MPPAILAHDLSRSFGAVAAVRGLSFEVAAGQRFALLGPNGAGKTTTVAMLTTMLRVGSGSASVAGYDVASQPHQVRASIGFVFQEHSLDEQLTAWENLDFHARIYGVPRSAFRARAAELLELVGLADRQRDAVRTFSGGMKRRLELARGLLHRPQVLFLDEPTAGLDPQTRLAIWEHLADLQRRESVTIFLTTHYLQEAEDCDRVAILDRGALIALDTPAALKAALGGDVITLASSDNAAAAQLLAQRGLAARGGPQDTLVVEVGQGEQFVPELVTLLAAASIRTHSISLRRPTLEDVFIKHTGRAIRDEEADGVQDLRRRGRLGARR
jgi:ABC-2 type transport system ATP-binding protein